MSALASIKRAAVIAPHADDEVLGCGGTIARLSAQGSKVDVVTVTKGQPPNFSTELAETVAAEGRRAHHRLGVNQSHFLDLPAAALDQVPHSAVNAAVGKILNDIAPDTLFVPFIGDIHLDHQVVFNAALVWARPRSEAAPCRVWAYETLSETNWWAPGITPPFVPNCFIDISSYLDAKVAAFECFRSQVKQFPDERSPEAIRALARTRGASVFREAAEAFMLVRQVF
jgi:LmbE family N-acetylglucosaminyl deacetylase